MGAQRTPRSTSTGKCRLCGGTFGKAGMTRHLESCREKRPDAQAAPAAPSARQDRVLHVVVSGRGSSPYWMHLEVPATATLGDLDDFLRRTWLECCGHMSLFEIGGVDYYSELVDGLPGRRMNVQLGKVLAPGLKFSHEYDFGTTTELALTVAAERQGPTHAKSIVVLARNDPPDIACDLCGRPATSVCVQCIYEGGGWLCDECAQEHPCGEDMLLPVVNSPRVGMCGYTGAEDWG